MFTPAERQTIGETWTFLATNYNRDLTRGAVSMLVNGVQDLPFDRVRAVLETWMGGKGAREFPLPYHVRDRIAPEVDDDTLAREAGSRVTAAVTRHGWNNSRAARAEIGELGWSVVTRFGGWQYICENLGRGLPVATFQAQARDICVAQVKLAKAGRLDQPIGLPAAEGGDRETLLAIQARSGKNLLGENL